MSKIPLVSEAVIDTVIRDLESQYIEKKEIEKVRKARQVKPDDK